MKIIHKIERLIIRISNLLPTITLSISLGTSKLCVGFTIFKKFYEITAAYRLYRLTAFNFYKGKGNLLLILGPLDFKIITYKETRRYGT